MWVIRLMCIIFRYIELNVDVEALNNQLTSYRQYWYLELNNKYLKNK